MSGCGDDETLTLRQRLVEPRRRRAFDRRSIDAPIPTARTPAIGTRGSEPVTGRPGIPVSEVVVVTPDAGPVVGVDAVWPPLLGVDGATRLGALVVAGPPAAVVVDVAGPPAVV